MNAVTGVRFCAVYVPFLSPGRRLRQWRFAPITANNVTSKGGRKLRRLEHHRRILIALNAAGFIFGSHLNI